MEILVRLVLMVAVLAIAIVFIVWKWRLWERVKSWDDHDGDL